MADGAILSDLCSSCHVQKPKYKCPRCATRTCSLKCGRLHKDRAQCSGVRDPTAFIKKTHLSTPAGFDHDYNFLSGLERQLAADAEETQARMSHSQLALGPSQRDKRGPQYHRRVQNLGVTIISAPRGMKRQQENQSRLGRKSHEVIWSTEWILENGSRCITNVLNTTPISVAFKTVAGLLNVAMPQATSRKRKRDTVDTTGHFMLPEATRKATEDLERGVNSADAQLSPKDDDLSELAIHNNPLVEHVANNAKKLVVSDAHEGCLDESLVQDENIGAVDRFPIPPLYFYLVKARTNGLQTTLIQVESSETLRDILHGQTVLEFPTIRVLHQTPGSLPPQFVLDQKYKDIALRPTSAQIQIKQNPEEQVEERAEQARVLQERITNGADLLTILQQDVL